jgi:hypothetical protein
MMGQWVQSCELGGTSGEGVHWTVDDLDSGGGLMTNKNKSLASESDGDVFVGMVPYLRWVTHGGSGESSIGSKTKLFIWKSFLARVPEFIYFFNCRFSIFLNPSFPPESEPNFWKWRVAKRTHRFLSCWFWFLTRAGSLPGALAWGMQHPQRARRGLVGDLLHTLSKMHDFYNLGPIIYNSYNLVIFSDIPRFFYRISLSIVPIL